MSLALPNTATTVAVRATPETVSTGNGDVYEVFGTSHARVNNTENGPVSDVDPFPGTLLQVEWLPSMDLCQIFGSRSKYSWSSFDPPSPCPSTFSESMNSIRSIHLTILYPSWFSTRNRRGAPCSMGSTLPFIL